MKTSFAVALAATGLASALPGVQQRTATYDNIVVAVPGAPFQPVGDYMGLDYHGFNTIVVGTPPTGVRTQSPPNAAVQYIGSTGTDETASIRADDGVNYFALNSFYFGCVFATGETVASAPRACSVHLTGRRNGVVVAEQDISYNPPAGALIANMKRQAVNAEFLVVDEVSFQVTSAGAATTAVLYDNVQYATFSA